MSALVEWRCSSNIASTLTSPTQEQWYDFFLAGLTTWTGDSASRWEIASSSKAGNPYYIVLKRKAGGNGRVIFIINTGTYTPRSTMNYPAASATANNMHVGFFPDGNLDTPAGFTGSGDFLGNDTGAVGFSGGANATTSVSTSYILKIYEHEDAFGFSFQSTAAAGINLMGGLIFDDPDGTAIQGSFYFGGNSLTAAAPVALGASVVGGSVVQSGTKKNLNRAATFVTQASAIRDTSNSRAYFLPIYGSAFDELYSKVCAYKFRQIAQGPQTLVGANFQELYVTGPSLRAVSLTAQANSSLGGPDLWLVNFLT